MKYLSTLVAATAAHSLFDESAMLGETTVGQGVCQVFADYDFFDLKKFDAVNRQSGQPAAITGFSSQGTFDYKTCQPKFKMDVANITSCASEGTAYWSENGACKYTFVNSKFDGIERASTSASSNAVDNIGFTLKWTSEEACGDGNFQFTLTAMCTESTDAKNGKFYTSSQTTCSAAA